MKNKIINVFEGLVLTFPLIAFLLSVFRSGTFDFTSINDMFTTLINSSVLELFYTFFKDNFLNGEINVLFNVAFGSLVYLVYVYLLILMFDFVLFIPKMARKWLSRFYN